MKLSRWDPFRAGAGLDPFRALEDVTARLNRLMGFRVEGPAEQALVTAEWTPVVDIQETDKEYLIKAELPEVKKEEVKVFIQDGVLTIEGERKQEKEEKNKHFHRVERCYGRFVRSFSVPKDADEKGVQADFKEGVLSVHVAKAEVPKPRSIEVKVA